MKAIKTALISVFHKDGLEPIVRKLNELNVDIISTGGTEKYISDLGLPVTKVEDLTSYPSILGGRVKTLHPKVFGGILARDSDSKEVKQHDIRTIDMVICNLYPFRDAASDGAELATLIEKIDISFKIKH